MLLEPLAKQWSFCLQPLPVEACQTLFYTLFKPFLRWDIYLATIWFGDSTCVYKKRFLKKEHLETLKIHSLKRVMIKCKFMFTAEFFWDKNQNEIQTLCFKIFYTKGYSLHRKTFWNQPAHFSEVFEKNFSKFVIQTNVSKELSALA